MDLGNRSDWGDSDSDYSSEDDFNADINGIRFTNALGWYDEHDLDERQRTPWVSLLSADALRPDYIATDDYDYSSTVLCCSGTILIKPEMMHHPPHDFQSILHTSPRKAGTLQIALRKIFNTQYSGLREQYKGLGIWGTEDENPWILMFDRFHVSDDVRRQGWGRKMAERILGEATAMARLAKKSVIVLAMPTPPQIETAAKTSGLNATDAARWREGSVRTARAFWRSIGFVRVGDTQFFGWTRSVQSQLLPKISVRSEELDLDAKIDRRSGQPPWFMTM